MAISLKVLGGIFLLLVSSSMLVFLTVISNPYLFLDKEKIILDNNLYAEAPRDSIFINHLNINNQYLIINFSYGGGCQKHEFYLIGSEEYMESYPVQTNILLSHNSNNDSCLAWFTEVKIFDLTPLQHQYQELYSVKSATIILRIQGGQEVFSIDFTF